MNKGMRTKLVIGAAGVGALAIVPAISFVAQGADHVDSPSAVAEPTADLTDLFAWMSADALKLNLIMNVHPFAAANAEFSTAVNYVFHVNSSAGYGMAQTETRIVCKFYMADFIECWGPSNEYVTGKADQVAGITSASGKMKVFAGLRDDPFFFNLTGFQETVKRVMGQTPPFPESAAGQGCPAIPEAVQTQLRTQLRTGVAGADPVNTFAGANVLSLVVQLDKTLVAPTGSPLLAVWSSTHRAQ